MVKIFLAEDEKIVREGIKNGIPWEKYGFEFAGEAPDGELAYPLILKSKPDILLTDIRMPFMDGLELAEMVKKELPGIRIMFFSGYDDFEYAKRAIRIGAADYLLKPVSSSQLLEALERMSEAIIQERSEKGYKLEFLKQQEERKRMERDRLFDTIVSGNLSLQEILLKGREHSLSLSAPAYNLILFQARASHNQEQYTDQEVLFDEMLKEQLEGRTEVIPFNRLTEGYAFLIMGNDFKDLEKKSAACSGLLIRLVESCPGMEYFGGTGVPVRRLSELKSCFQAASRAYACRYMLEYNQFLTAEAAVRLHDDSGSISLEGMDMTKLSRDIVPNFLKNGSVPEVKYFLEEYLEACGNNLKSLIFRQYLIMDMYLAVVSFVTQLGFEPEQVLKEFGDAETIKPWVGSEEAAVKYAREILTKAITFRTTCSQKKYRLVLDRARDYIGSHYLDEDISLNVVASTVNISPNHFSTIFSQEMGITFVEYLTKVRMEAAKELLLKTDLRASEIGYQVGYKDPHYFSYIFKKTHGITPKAFRAGGRNEART
ncbi:response regulator transcription factor [Lacrimispora saccharolytica]|uniref:Stage 0 sporulation protein A homolog n=1 Tax=Lacrimispora saccharolytica (strain ATCC 35040 / DSM 2544 / NRCC 2533 / WM1) TaxID=610130 RepID=D9R202_LACSW|nr:response regulator [Lacrimispora saccharolytica]ADL02893.1 two component transcriptional regulator, AraC family [[Clostridium] saccharolyticum WM1]QRV18909.1 response regulator [Lacrimispora saccharolytica]